MFVKSGMMESAAALVETQAMIENGTSFGSRFDALRGERSYQALSDAIMESTGIRISPQAMHLWVKKGGDISAENLKLLAAFFDVRESWLRFGEGAMRNTPGIEDMLRAMPIEDAQMSLDLLKFNVERASDFIAQEKVAVYMAMLDRFKDDLADRKNKDSGKKQ